MTAVKKNSIDVKAYKNMAIERR